MIKRRKTEISKDFTETSNYKNDGRCFGSIVCPPDTPCVKPRVFTRSSLVHGMAPPQALQAHHSAPRTLGMINYG